MVMVQYLLSSEHVYVVFKLHREEFSRIIIIVVV